MVPARLSSSGPARSLPFPRGAALSGTSDTQSLIVLEIMENEMETTIICRSYVGVI